MMRVSSWLLSAVALVTAHTSAATLRAQSGAPASGSTAGGRAVARPVTDSARAASVVWTRVSYISGATLYLEVGRNHGLAEGTVLELVRGGTVLGVVRVTALASTRAAGEMQTGNIEPVVGDSLRFSPVAQPAVAAATGSTRASPSVTTMGLRAPALRGRLGVRYMVISADVGGLQQPAYDLRLDGDRIGGTPFGISADVRAQQTRYAASSAGAARTNENATRVYQAALSWSAPRAGVRAAVGRQMSTALSSVGLFDGVAVDVDRQHFGLGAFAGSQPDDRSFGVSSRVREYGAHATVHTAPGRPQNTSVTLGGVGSYVGAAIDREYAFARVMSNGPVVSLYATQELDFNRGWKRDAERSATTPTATFVSVHVSPARMLALYGGFDNRRSVRLYRDYQSPELAFDDAFREGSWAGLAFSTPRYARVSVDRRDSRGGVSGSAQSTTVMGSLTGISPLRLGVRGRFTAFTGAVSAGQLVSGAIEAEPWGRLRFEANGGARRTSSNAAAVVAAPSQLTWLGGDADIGVGRSLYVMLSAYRERDADRTSMQTYLAISWRF